MDRRERREEMAEGDGRDGRGRGKDEDKEVDNGPTGLVSYSPTVQQYTLYSTLTFCPESINLFLQFSCFK